MALLALADVKWELEESSGDPLAFKRETKPSFAGVPVEVAKKFDLTYQEDDLKSLIKYVRLKLNGKFYPMRCPLGHLSSSFTQSWHLQQVLYKSAKSITVPYTTPCFKAFPLLLLAFV